MSIVRGLGERFVYEFRVLGREFRGKAGAQWAAVEVAGLGWCFGERSGVRPIPHPARR